MPILLYVFVVFILLIAVGFFWFINSNQQFKNNYELTQQAEKDINLGDLFLRETLRSLEVTAEKGKWLLFLSIFLILIEFFIFIAYFIQNAGAPMNLQGFQHLYFIGGLVYFFVLLFAVFLSVRILSIAKEIPHYLGGFSWQRPYMETRIHELDSNQKKHLSFISLEKKNQIEQNFTAAIVMISIASTLLLVFAARWLFLTLN